ncbi:MAG: hypothetical protein ACOCQD_01455 [archaeon]
MKPKIIINDFELNEYNVCEISEKRVMLTRDYDKKETVPLNKDKNNKIEIFNDVEGTELMGTLECSGSGAQSTIVYENEDIKPIPGWVERIIFRGEFRPTDDENE